MRLRLSFCLFVLFVLVPRLACAASPTPARSPTCQAYKTFGLQKGDYELYLVFSREVPTFAMRGVAHDTLLALANSDTSTF